MIQRLIPFSIALLRFGAGVLIVFFHGWEKLLACGRLIFLGVEWGFVNMLGTAGFPSPAIVATVFALVETIAAFFFAIGFLTRYAAFALALVMAVMVGVLIRTGGNVESNILYFLVALLFGLSGSHKYSIDFLRTKRAQR